MTKQTFLVEIGTEELPPKALRTLAEAFAAHFTAQLTQADLSFSTVKWLATPRRLALQVKGLSTEQGARQIEKRGPALSQAFDSNGQPTPAAKGWARGCGIEIAQAEQLVTDKGTWLVYRGTVTGKKAITLLPALVSQALAQLPIPKPMRWGDSPIQFIRPVHTVTMLLGEQLVEGEVLGITSARTIRGHRFMGSDIELVQADLYQEALQQQGKVLVDHAARKAIIQHDAQIQAKKIGGIVDLNPELLEEVTSLVEWPVVLTAQFEERFLNVPAEALVHTMKSDQKYFPVYDKQGNLLPHFIFVTNIESKDPQQIIKGNEKVIRPRLADAEFFFNSDRKQRLEEHLPRLGKVLFQQQLGSLRDKTDRIQQLAGWIAGKLGADVNLATRAGLLSKCDLMTNMVSEFPETQGVMGMYYARFDGESEEVALALKEHYQPRFAGDHLPQSNIACAVAIADKIDTLVGIFGINQPPKGDKDPFALRRAALGILRISVEKSLDIDLLLLIQQAVQLYEDKLTYPQVTEAVFEFILGRFRAWYQEQGHSVDTIQAVLARRPTSPTDFDARMKAVSHFRSLTESTALAAANKRVSNILVKSQEKLYDQVQNKLLIELAEKALAEQVILLQEKLAPLFVAGNYQQALVELATLREPVDTFFEQVMVMVEEDAVRINRLTLLQQLRALFLHIADISLLQM